MMEIEQSVDVEDDFDMGDDQLMDKALTIMEDVSSFDPNDTPTNGHEYLAKVQFEAKKIPKIVTANFNRSKFVSRQTFSVPQTETYNIPQSYLPSEEWQQQQLQDFDKLRKKIYDLRERQCELNTSKKPKILKSSSQDSWYSFYFGKNDKDTETLPLLSIMLPMKQHILSKQLSHFDDWLNEGKISINRKTCLWLYSLLACLDEPLLPGTIASLRSLACQASKARSNIINANDETLTVVNLIICLVSRYFKQKDLAD